MKNEIDQIIDMESYISLMKKKSLMYEPVLECMEEGIEACDEHGHIFYVNDRFLKLSGMQKEERLNQNILEVHPSGVLATVLNTRQPMMNAITTIPGREGQALASGFPLYENNNFVGAVLILKDVSQAVQLSIRLNQKESYLSEIYKQSTKHLFSDVIANEEKMKKLVGQARDMALQEMPILIQGDMGTGKDHFASAIHSISARNKKPFMKLDCSKSSDKEISYQLFGYEKNAFPDAEKSKIGLLELADGGTVYLDHLDKLPLSIQSKLVRSLKEKKVYRFGGNDPFPIQARLLASTNKNFKDCHESGLINEEFYHYLKEHCLHLPPLRERTKDIPDLVNMFISEFNHKLGKHLKITKEALDVLMNYSWPGNIKELKTTIMCMILKADSNMLTKDIVLSALPYEYVDSIQNSLMSLKEIEKLAISKALKFYGYSLNGKQKAAETLQISLGTLYNKMRDYDL
jgi:PAS domain S-box-containing protein